MAASLKVFGWITMVCGLLTTIICVWLLISTLTEDCAGYGHASIWDRYRYQDNRRSGVQYGDTRYGNNRGPGFGRNDYLRRDREHFCVNLVEQWINGSSIGIAVGIMQMCVSFLLLRKIDSKPRVGIWSIGHVFLVACMIAAFAVGYIGEVYDSWEVEIVGKLFVGILVLNALISLLLSFVGCLKLCGKGQDTKVYKQEQEIY